MLDSCCLLYENALLVVLDDFLAWHAWEQGRSCWTCPGELFVAQNEKLSLKRRALAWARTAATYLSLLSKGSPKQRPLAWASWASLSETSTCHLFVVLLRREQVAWARGFSRLSESSLAWARLAELRAYAYVLHDWLMGVLNNSSYDVIYIYIPYDILGPEVNVFGMRLVWYMLG